MITFDQTLAALVALPENGSNGERCAYADSAGDGVFVPRCAVGHVLSALAPTTFERVARSDWNESDVDQLLAARLLDDFDARAVNLLSAVQNYADDGDTWGEALGIALAEL